MSSTFLRILKNFFEAGSRAATGSGDPAGEPFEHCGRFVAEADFGGSAVFGAVRGDRAEGVHEGGVFEAVHHVGDPVSRGVNVGGGGVAIEVGVQVRPLADRGAGALDLVVQAVGAEVVAEIIGFCDLARESKADGLFRVLAVVAVVVQVVESEVCHGCRPFLSPLGHCYYTTTRPGCQPLF